MNEAEPSGTGAIQPIGFLLCLSSDWRVTRASANIGEHLGAEPAVLLGQPMTALFSPAAVHSLRNRLALLRGPDAIERLFGIQLTSDGPAHYDVAVHMSGDQALIEAERTQDHHHDRESTGTVRGMIAQLARVDALDAFFGDAARQVRALTGYDRVLIHRFGHAGADEVVGEARRSSAIASPAADCPPLLRAPASPRALVSLVADVDAVPVAVLPLLDRRGRPANLTRTAFRAAPQDDLDQLRKAGVKAAMSIALVVGGRLWGQISCHHHVPICPSFERRSAAEWYAIMLAMQIEIRELKARLGA